MRFWTFKRIEVKKKLSMLEKKQGQFWNLHQIPYKTLNPDFRLIFFDDGRFSNKNYNYFFLVQKKPEIKKTKTKIDNRDSKFC